MKVRASLETKASPEQVVAAFTDFTDRRPDIWPALDRKQYKVHELGDTWAHVTEGSPKPQVWARERYDWSGPGTIAWTVEESNFCKAPSGITVRVDGTEGGGSHLEVDWERTPSNFKWTLILGSMKMMMPKVLAKNWSRALDAYAADS